MVFTNTSWLRFLCFLVACLSIYNAHGQCTVYEQVTHPSGTQQVGCVSVTVMPDFTSSYIASCDSGPYWVAASGSGSFMFVFSATVPEVRVNIAYLDNSPPLHFEEVSFEINGSFYPITTLGVANSCGTPALLSAGGTIIGDPTAPFPGSSWSDIVITEPINSLKVTNNWLYGMPNGIELSIYFCCPNCPTDAGEIVSSPLGQCPDEPAIVPSAGQTLLDADDLLEYVLFADLTDTLGSIVQTSSIPQFSFDPVVSETN